MDVDSKPTTNLQTVLDDEVKEWMFHVYFYQNNADHLHAAQELRDAILRLRRDGAFVAVPLFRIHTVPTGPHPVGSFEVWVPSETFSSAFSYVCQNRGDLSVLVHPLTKEPRRDYGQKAAWLGTPLPLDLSALPETPLDTVPSYYPTLKLGHSAFSIALSLDDRRRLGQNVENILNQENGAARAPHD
eukprot:GHVO01030876.1.p1 GENE.GHVO01030876.1~~GHVO01030876.1.p1  ORF type:complete len:201 (+),score=6.28 GHVO01030876.1:43-603(+)